MANFDEILANLHAQAILSDEDTNNPVVVTSRRSFEPPASMNLVLGYVGDVNSQIVTFQLPRYHEEHDLHACANKKLKWKNTKSGTEGISTLNAADASEDSTWIATWEVPPELMTTAGAIEIAISLFDTKNGTVAFAWNTASYKGFSISEGYGEIGDFWGDGSLPARNEILNIDTENRAIVMPAGYNTIVANYGDIGTSRIFFQISRYIKGIDILDGATAMYINVSMGNSLTDEYLLDTIQPLFQSDAEGNGNKLLITWVIPADITNNAEYYTGSFTISIKLIVKDGEQIVKRWTTSTFSKLSIGTSLLLTDVNSIAERDEYIVKKVVSDVIDDEINEYFDETYFVTDGNKDS